LWLQIPLFRIPFTVNIPQETKDGEYSAGISVTELESADQRVNIALRNGIRSYIAVGSDFNLDADIADLNIVDPKDDNFDNVLRTRRYAGRENMLIEVKVRNTGNIFGVVDAKYSIEYEDGTVYESSFATETAPGVGVRTYYIITNQPYRVGQTNVVFDYTLKPLNISPDKVNNLNPKGVLGDSLNLTQDEYDNFSSAKQKAFISKSQDIEILQEESKESTFFEKIIYIALPITIFLGLIGGVLVAEGEIWKKDKN
jgi:hypothetical protein